MATAPFLKWAGGKRKLVTFISQHLPFPTKRLIEPFAGSAAFGLALAAQAEKLWLNDVNADLINVYRHLQTHANAFIAASEALFRPETNNAETYYELRTTFNTTEQGSLHRAALFLYLNRHGYNGLCRYNDKGLFNVPFGRYVRPYFPEDELHAAARVLVCAKITQQDFAEVLATAGPGDVVYCDPPYVPLSATASFTAYAAGGFGPADHERLARAARSAAERGATVAISNHDTNFTRTLYANAKCYFRMVRRTISRDGANRNEVREVLAVYEAQPGRQEAGVV